MFSLIVVQKPAFPYSQDILDEIALAISKNILKQQKGVLNIAFIEPDGIQNLNKKYRDKDSVTDVLSFHYHDDFSGLQDDDIAGEIVLCEERVISQGQEYGLGSEKEFYKLVTHSVLHILGFDHETDEDYEEMKKWERLVWEEVFTQ